jgi:CRISPR/Cas system-associated exonuclease Cas4 (RecB family)
MKKLNEKQTKINYQLTKMIIESDDEPDTKTAVICAQCAFFNYINTGEKVEIKVTPTGL